MSVTAQTLTLASSLDEWPYKENLFPALLKDSHNLNVQNALNTCKLSDSSLLKDCDLNSPFGKAYKYWIMAPYDMKEWARLGTQAPQEIELVGRYLLTVERLNAVNTYQDNPDWLKRDFSCCKKIAAVFLIAGIIGLLSAGIFLTLKYYKK